MWFNPTKLFHIKIQPYKIISHTNLTLKIALHESSPLWKLLHIKIQPYSNYSVQKFNLTKKFLRKKLTLQKLFHAKIRAYMYKIILHKDIFQEHLQYKHFTIYCSIHTLLGTKPTTY